ncbi:MAG TPA: hypothetical protein VJS42_20855 [Steroidobacteraceae bacterium]|nr:hypothetical protein [Steroidobacteraceae bacterium]
MNNPYGVLVTMTSTTTTAMGITMPARDALPPGWHGSGEKADVQARFMGGL